MDYCQYIFPEVDRRGCKFHFCQAIIRNVNELGLKPLYSAQDECFETFVRSVFALSFLPIERVILAFEGLVKTLDNLRAANQREVILSYQV